MDQTVIIALSCVQFFGPPIPHPRVLCTGESGFSVDFQFLYIAAFLFKYQPYTATIYIGEVPADKYVTYYIQCLARRALFIMAMVSFWTSFFVTNYYEKKPNKNWIFSVMVASLVLAINLADLKNNDLTSTFYTAGLYLDVVACIPQFQLSLKKMHLKLHVIIYYLGMFIYDILNMSGLTYDSYKSKLYTQVGINLFVLKFVITCGFFLKYLCKKCNNYRLRAQNPNQGENRASRNNRPIEVAYANSELPVFYTTDKYSDGLLFRILKGDDVLINEHGLMLPS